MAGMPRTILRMPNLNTNHIPAMSATAAPIPNSPTPTERSTPSTRITSTHLPCALAVIGRATGLPHKYFAV